MSWRSKSQVWRRPEARETAAAEDVAWKRSDLMRPGSHPRRCSFRCHGCTPCSPVSPRAPADATECYPEAWRCKCGGRVYVP